MDSPACSTAPLPPQLATGQRSADSAERTLLPAARERKGGAFVSRSAPSRSSPRLSLIHI
eukprot:10018492-Prorocentrum_lima.AAC.1